MKKHYRDDPEWLNRVFDRWEAGWSAQGRMNRLGAVIAKGFDDAMATVLRWIRRAAQ